MKYLLLFLPFGLAGYFIYDFIEKSIKKIKIETSVWNIDFSKLSIGKTVTVPLKIKITNSNNFNIRFSNLYVELFYKKETIGYIIDPIKETQRLNANSSLTFETQVIIKINPYNISLIKDAIAKIPLDITVVTWVNLYSFPIKIETKI